MPVVAEQGFSEFSLEQIAAEADVTRNNLYRYFPRGRPDIALEVVREAGRRLTVGWVTEPDLSLEDRLQANIAQIAEQAFAQSDAWRIHRKARAADRPELSEIVTDYLNTVVANISLNNLGTTDPPPSARVAILAMIAFAETIVDEARTTGVPQAEISQIILATLVAALRAVQDARVAAGAQEAG